MADLQSTKMITTKSLTLEGKWFRGLHSYPQLSWINSSLRREIPLTPPMLAMAAAGDAADEENAAANEAAGSTAEAHPAPHSPPFSPVREYHTGEEAAGDRMGSLTLILTCTDWRCMAPVPKHSWDLLDPDTIDPIIFGPPPVPMILLTLLLRNPLSLVPYLGLPTILGALETLDNLLFSMEDDTFLGGFPL
ncbi:hypothetical protein Tco_0273158 [Tanacetum coccineum]